MLTEAVRKLGLPDPVYGLERNQEQVDGSFVEVIVNRGDPPQEIIKAFGSFGVEQLKLEEQVAIFALNNLQHWFHFEVRDFNFEDKEDYKHSYQRMRARYNVLSAELQQLRWDYERLRDINQKHIDEYSNLQRQVDKLRQGLPPDSASSFREN